ncbi:MAG: YihY/virulence factor BrkB family protein [Betaproteobacteria bacterium]|nr:MAG: YihY/virulence factor BrkB family protein [Betaproteobacteria bacterium]
MRRAVESELATSGRATFGERSAYILKHPGGFALCVLRSFRKNQGLLLAGAVAYYALLSLIPLLILMVMGLSHVIDQARLLATMSEYLEFIVPGQSEVLVGELRDFLDHGQVIGGVLLVTMVLFSALAFTVLENAMSVIFYHRVAISRRRFIVSAVMPYLFIVFLAVGLLIVTIVAGKLASLATRNITIFGVPHSLGELSNYLLYTLGVGGEILILTAIYLVMPVGRLSLRHALMGGVTAGLLWEIARHVLAWYYGTMSQVRVVYGSLTTAILVLLSAEIGAILFLLGAQVIAEYERIQRQPADMPQPALTTENETRTLTGRH